MRVPAAAWLCACLTVQTGVAQTIRTYDVQFTTQAPSIDGAASPGEWDDADVADDFRLLGTLAPGLPDGEETQWQALWDASGLYLLTTSNYGFWSPNPGGSDTDGGLDFFADNLTFYLDPNVDGEDNLPPGETLFEAVDVYQLGFNQWEGASSFDSSSVQPNDNLGGLAVDGFVDGTFPPFDGDFAHGSIYDAEADEYVRFGRDAAGDDGAISLPSGLEISQNNTADGGLVELKIPWSFFDAWLPTPEEPDAEPGLENDVSGLYHPFAPENEETWFFNVGRVSSDAFNEFPTWNYSEGFTPFPHPHGEITFLGREQVLLLGDYNGDETVDLQDFNILKANFGGSDEVFAPGSSNGDGVVDLLDFNDLKGNFGASGAVVPEPSSLALATAAAAGTAWLLRRRRAA